MQCECSVDEFDRIIVLDMIVTSLRSCQVYCDFHARSTDSLTESEIRLMPFRLGQCLNCLWMSALNTEVGWPNACTNRVATFTEISANAEDDQYASVQISASECAPIIPRIRSS